MELGVQNDCTSDIFDHRWIRLCDGLPQWVEERPSELLPVLTTSSKVSRHTLILHLASISSKNRLYHTPCSLLLETMPKSIKVRPTPAVSPLWHARRLCGISVANLHEGCLDNAVLLLWIAGQLFSHSSEHAIIIINIIWKIETKTGWGAC